MGSIRLVGLLFLMVVLGGGVAAAFEFVGGPESASVAALPGPPANLGLEMSPAEASCSPYTYNVFTVTAHVTDSGDNPVADGTNVRFFVPALGFPNPVDATTLDGSASTSVTVMSQMEQLVPVYATSGSLESALGFYCKNSADPPLPTPTGPPSPPVATPTATATP